MKRALYFSLYCKDKDNVDYYSMLYYALQTLEKHRPFNYDVVVCYSTPNFNFHTYNHLGKFNLEKDFPWVKFYSSKFVKHNTDTQTHKWFNLGYLFKLKYEQVFYLDCDVIFTKDPSYIFDKYPKTFGIYQMWEGADTVIAKVLGRSGAASGQWLIDIDTFRMTNNLFECILNKRIELRNKAYEILDKSTADWYCTIDEQYAAQMALVDQGIPSIAMHAEDVNWHEVFDINIKDDDVEFVDLNKTTILHYLGPNGHFAIPKYLRTPKMQEMINKYIKEHK